MIPASLVKKTHKLRKRLKWVYLKDDSLENMNFHWMFLLGKSDAKADKDVEFMLLSNNDQLDSVIKRLNEGGRKTVRIPLAETEAKPKKEAPTAQVTKETKEALVVLRPDPKPTREEKVVATEEETVLLTVQETLKKLQSTGQRPENLETLKHYIHLFNTSPGNQRVSIDQILDHMEAQHEISISQGLVTYNF